ncbi:MAG: capsular biosynthesis protein, partial [Cocleimonas sp.]|nr:capsular biosynthesis protein [Cocleimonas sp.]
FPKGLSYKGAYNDWIGYLDNLVVDKKIDQVFLFGDERLYHKLAINEVFKSRNIDIHVFEEGYLRPSFITLEECGVNGNSIIPKDASFYESNNFIGNKRRSDKPVVKGQFFKSMLFSVIYGLAKFIGLPVFRKYKHHRCLSPVKQGILWLWGGVFKKPYFRITEKQSYQKIRELFRKKYFFVPLQVHNDFQISHSPYKDVKEFIEEIVVSFASHAPKDTILVFKHHPMDRPYRNYKKFLKQLSGRYQLEERVFYLHDQPLPSLLDNAIGTIVINSTVGLSSLFRGVPVLVKGTAVYDVPGLTCQSSLEGFWNDQGTVDANLYNNYRCYLLQNNQGHGSFYQKGYNNTPTGIYWPPNISMFHLDSLINKHKDSSVLSQSLSPENTRSNIAQAIILIVIFSFQIKILFSVFLNGLQGLS